MAGDPTHPRAPGKPLFRRTPPIGDELPFGIEQHGRRLRPPPELESPRPRGIANQIDRDLHQPGLDGSLAAKPFPTPVRPQETILGHGFGRVRIAQRRERKPVNPKPVRHYNLLEISLNGDSFHSAVQTRNPAFR